MLRRKMFRFRLLWIFVLFAIVAGALVWWVHLQQVTVEARLLMRRQPPRLLVDPTQELEPLSPLESARDRADLAKWATSRELITDALSQPGLAGNKLLKGQEQPVTWIEDRLVASFEGDSRVLAISMRGRKEWAADMIPIVETVAQLLEQKMSESRRLKCQMVRDALEQHLTFINNRLEERLRKFQQTVGDRTLAEEELPPGLAIQQIEIDAFKEMASELQGKALRWEIEATALEQVHVFQKASIR